MLRSKGADIAGASGGVGGSRVDFHTSCRFCPKGGLKPVYWTWKRVRELYEEGRT